MQDPSSLQHPSTKPPKKGKTGRGGEGSVREENKGGDGRKRTGGTIRKKSEDVVWKRRPDSNGHSGSVLASPGHRAHPLQRLNREKQLLGTLYQDDGGSGRPDRDDRQLVQQR